MKNQGFPDWFNGTIYETGDKVKNPFTQESLQLDLLLTQIKVKYHQRLITN